MSLDCRYFPFGVLFLLVHSCITGDDLGVHLADVRVYILTVLVGLFVHSFVLLPLCYHLVVKKSPLVFAWKCFQAIMVGFGEFKVRLVHFSDDS